MLNDTFQSIFQHVTYVTTQNYFIIETYSFTVPKKTVDVRNLCFFFSYFFFIYFMIMTCICIDLNISVRYSGKLSHWRSISVTGL